MSSSKSPKEINRQILTIAVPNILSNITIPLLGIIDTVLMGHKGEQAAFLIGAIGLGGIVFNAIYWNFGFLRIATTGITAQAYGSKNTQKQAQTLFRALLLGAILAGLILLLKPIIEQYGFAVLSNEKNQEALALAKRYFKVRILAVPAVMLLYGFRGWFYGMQNAIFPFILTTVVNLTNIAASIYFVQVKDMDVDGVALGTVVAQYTCLVVAIALVLYRYRWLFINLKEKFVSFTSDWNEFFTVSGFSLGRNIMLFLVFAQFSYFSSTINDTYFAANQILLELFYLMSFAVDGFAYASESLVGKFVGAKENNNLLLSIRQSLVWGIGFGLIYAVLYLFFGQHFLSFFTPNEDIIAVGKHYLFWLSILSIVGSVAFIWDGIYIGATLVKPMFLFMTISTISFFISLFLLRDSFPKHAVWIAISIYMFIRGLLQWTYFNKTLKKQFA